MDVVFQWIVENIIIQKLKWDLKLQCQIWFLKSKLSLINGIVRKMGLFPKVITLPLMVSRLAKTWITVVSGLIWTFVSFTLDSLVVKFCHSVILIATSKIIQSVSRFSDFAEQLFCATVQTLSVSVQKSHISSISQTNISTWKYYSIFPQMKGEYRRILKLFRSNRLKGF